MRVCDVRYVSKKLRDYADEREVVKGVRINDQNTEILWSDSTIKMRWKTDLAKLAIEHIIATLFGYATI